MRFVTSVVARSTSCYHVSGPCCLSADTFFAIICIIIINNYRTAGGVWRVADTENCEKLRSQQRQVLYTNSVQYLVQYYHIYNQILDCFFFSVFFFIAVSGYFRYAKNMRYKPRSLARLKPGKLIVYSRHPSSPYLLWQTYCLPQTPLYTPSPIVHLAFLNLRFSSTCQHFIILKLTQNQTAITKVSVYFIDPPAPPPLLSCGGPAVCATHKSSFSVLSFQFGFR